MENRGNEFNKLGKVLHDKMMRSANDSHYASKYWVRFNPNDSTRPIDAPRDGTFFGNPIIKLLLLPIWLPYWYWNKQRKMRGMEEFVVAWAGGKPANDELIRQLALQWVALHPREFVLGEYDPKVSHLEDTFLRIFRQKLDWQTSGQVSDSVEAGARAGNKKRAGHRARSFDLSLLPHIARIVGMVFAGFVGIMAVVFLWLWLLS